MKARFYMLILFVTVFAAAAIVHYDTYDHKGAERSVLSVVEVDGLSFVSLSASWFEPRVYGYDSTANSVYPELPPLNRFSFAYGGAYGK